ncbi:uncharacterized protein V1518DRAFT_423425 [Limtongia smithiae]|uniref:uncharacterized protein n=1 Tax=Limtongia smithiae TaxID=1125753 RepID=UPI0034CE855D
MTSLTDTIEGLPGYSTVMDLWTDYAGEKLQTKDPFFEEVNGEQRRRKAPEGSTPSDAAVFRKIQRAAWKHDRCMCGCFWADWGIGQAPVVDLIPVIGPWVMYTLHLRLNRMAEDLHVPQTLQAKMSANVLFDFLMSLIPLLGAVFAYINACSTRNAAIVHSFLEKRARENKSVSAVWMCMGVSTNSTAHGRVHAHRHGLFRQPGGTLTTGASSTQRVSTRPTCTSRRHTHSSTLSSYQEQVYSAHGQW